MTYFNYIPKDFNIFVFLLSDELIISEHSFGMFSYPSLSPKLLKLTNTLTIALSIELCKSTAATTASDVKFYIFIKL